MFFFSNTCVTLVYSGVVHVSFGVTHVLLQSIKILALFKLFQLTSQIRVESWEYKLIFAIYNWSLSRTIKRRIIHKNLDLRNALKSGIFFIIKNC